MYKQKLYLIRHGQTDWNLEKRKQGRVDLAINETGRKQAMEVGYQLKDIKFDLIYSSPLIRAKETCEIILSRNKFSGGGYIVLDNRIIERDFGEYEGFTEAMFDYPKFWNSEENQKFERAEGIPEMEKRVFNFLDELKEKTKGKNVNIMLVAHGGVNIIIQAYFLGKPKDGNYLSYLKGNASCQLFEF